MRNETPQRTPHQQKWLAEVTAYLKARLGDPNLVVKDMAGAFYLSERQFYRKMKAAAGLTPNRFLQTLRLEKAREGLAAGDYATVKEAATAVGFANANYFSHLFQAHFGRRPAVYFRKNENVDRIMR